MAEATFPHAILFADSNFRGEHVHVFQPTELGAMSFADKVSSIVIERGTWVFYRDPGFKYPYKALGPGIYPWVEAEGIWIVNDSLDGAVPVATVSPALQAEIDRNSKEVKSLMSASK